MKPLYVLGAIAVVGVGSGLYYHFTNPSNASLTRRELPGFSIALPSGDEESLPVYREGHLRLRDVSHSGGMLELKWEPGAMFSDDDIAMTTRALVQLVKGGETMSPERMTGPHGDPIVTVRAKTDKGLLYMSFTTCGARRLMLVTAGDRMEGLQRRVISSVDCHPDPKSDAEVGAMPWVFDPPSGWNKVDAPAGQARFASEHAMLMVRALDKAPSRADVANVVPKLMAAAGMDIKLGDWIGDRLVMHATLEGETKSGFVMSATCPRGAALALVFADDDATADQVHDVITAHGHCATSAVLTGH